MRVFLLAFVSATLLPVVERSLLASPFDFSLIFIFLFMMSSFLSSLLFSPFFSAQSRRLLRLCGESFRDHTHRRVAKFAEGAQRISN